MNTMNAFDALPVVREAEWLYNGSVPVRVKILKSPETLGTADHGDAPEVAQNSPVECFFVVYESVGSPGVFNNGLTNLPTLERAVAEVEARFPGVRWMDDTGASKERSVPESF